MVGGEGIVDSAAVVDPTVDVAVATAIAVGVVDVVDGVFLLQMMC